MAALSWRDLYNLVEDRFDFVLILLHLIFDFVEFSLHFGDSGFMVITKSMQLSIDGSNCFTRVVKDRDKLHLNFLSLHFVGVDLFLTKHTSVFLGSDQVAESTESDHGNDEWNANCTCNDKTEDLEEFEVTEEQAEPTTKCSEASTENTYTHFSVSLSHFIVSPDLGRMHVICRQVDDVVYGEPDQDDEGDGFSGSKL